MIRTSVPQPIEFPTLHSSPGQQFDRVNYLHTLDAQCIFGTLDIPLSVEYVL